MPWTQYSQNLEDVMLRRALQGVERGCFVDVGAYHPIYSSNTYALYERGWRGIAVDAQEELRALWAQYRPEDVFLSVVAGAHGGTIEFHCPLTMNQMATTDAGYAEHYRRVGWETNRRQVRMTSLNSIFDTHLRGRELHLLAMDVEGGEYDALTGLDFARYRPWIVVVEATIPGSPVPSHSRWEPLLTCASYEMVYFDGLNRFYLAREHIQLREHFLLPPNVWDNYVNHHIVELEAALSNEKARCQALEQRIVSLPELLGRAHSTYQAGDISQAANLYRSILESAPDHFDALYKLGEIAQATGRLDEALGFTDRALRVNPDSVTARVLAGIVFLQLERYAEAVACFDLLLTIDPTNIGAMVNQAYALNGLYRHDDAISVCNRALALKPDCKIALVNCGVASGCLNRHADALDYFDRALVLDPQDTGVLNNRGLVLLKLRRFDDALSCFSSALKITPDSPEILTNCGFTLRKLGRYSEALASYEHAISIQSDFGEAIWNETLCKLMLGQFDVSATKLEWLWTKGFLGRKAPGISCPVWTGQQDLNGKSILLHEHQGLGDAILFARYAQRVAEKGATVYLDVVPPLKHLMKRIQGVNRVLNSSEPHPAMDFQCSLSSLPFAFGTTFSTIPAPIPYLSIEKEVIASWRAKLALGDEKLVGVCWRGSPHYSDDAERSIEFSLFASMFSVPGVRFVSLQKELTDVEFPLANKLPQFVHSGAEFMSTAEIVAALDLIISVDTVWAHCAGALGTPVWVLSPFVPHWFWFIEREDSPWYPTARLFRQSEIGNWHGVIRKVKEALSRETPSIATSARF